MTEPPSGAPAPVTASLPDGTSLDLRALAEEICSRYRAEFPDEQDRYGDAGAAWCVHDNQYLLSWAVTESKGFGGFTPQLEWLMVVLHARDFPFDRLARNLEIAATVLNEEGARHPGPAGILADGARFVRSRASFPTAPG